MTQNYTKYQTTENNFLDFVIIAILFFQSHNQQKLFQEVLSKSQSLLFLAIIQQKKEETAHFHFHRLVIHKTQL